jgi:hypothetical protein
MTIVCPRNGLSCRVVDPSIARAPGPAVVRHPVPLHPACATSAPTTKGVIPACPEIAAVPRREPAPATSTTVRLLDLSLDARSAKNRVFGPIVTNLGDDDQISDRRSSTAVSLWAVGTIVIDGRRCTTRTGRTNAPLASRWGGQPSPRLPCSGTLAIAGLAAGGQGSSCAAGAWAPSRVRGTLGDPEVMNRGHRSRSRQVCGSRPPGVEWLTGQVNADSTA